MVATDAERGCTTATGTWPSRNCRSSVSEEDRRHIGHQRDRVLTTDIRISSCHATRVDDGSALVTGCRKRGCPCNVPNPGRKWLPIMKYRSSGGRRHHCPCLLYTSPSPRDGLLSRMPS